MPAHGGPRDFDVWVGEWDVFGPQDRREGTNSVVLLFDGAAVSEHWRGAGGVEGRSLNVYDAPSGRWHQTWVDSTGGLLVLDGGLVDGCMVLVGTAPPDDGGEPERQRITWTPEDGGVRQLWESSADGGTTWVTAFDGHYRRGDGS